MLIPLKQGLKPQFLPLHWWNSSRLNVDSIKTRIETDPAEPIHLDALRLNVDSIKTRIETADA